MEQPRRQFLDETENLIEQIFAVLDQLREPSESLRQRELIDTLFRQVHRVKGSAASFGFSGLAEIAHEFEHLLEALRSERLILSDAVLDNCENATIALSESLTLAIAGVVEPSRRDLFESLRALAPPVEPTVVLDENLKKLLAQLSTELSQALTDEERRRIARRHAEGNSLCVVAINLELAGLQEQFYGFKEKLAELGEVISTSPASDPKNRGRVNFQVLLSTREKIQTLGSKLERFPNVAITQLGVTASSQRQSGPLALPSSHAQLAADFIRTDLNDLDQLLSNTHELARLTTAALDKARFSRADGAEMQLENEADQVRRSFFQLQQDMIKLRMVSLGPTLQRAARAGRATARSTNKHVDFEIIGSELQLDKLLADAVADPLVHLVRNAVDHAIEDAEVRRAAGKPERGKVKIEAVRVGSRTRVRVIDDGRGIHAETISEAAARLGIIDRSTTLDRHRSLRLIFRPGFTTLTDATEVSGRGVGLDIVETSVERVGGEVRISSEPGKGSIFEIRLPVTFSLLESTIVKVGEDRYCLANSEVTEVMESQRFSEVEGAGNSLSTETGAVPLVRLSDVLGGSESANDGASLITCELPLKVAKQTGELFEIHDGKRLIGLVVDRVAGTEEVLVRNLGRHGGRWYGVAGAAELEDGTVALVLDLPRLLASSRIQSH